MAEEKDGLTAEQIKGILEMYEHYQRGRWLGRLIWKVCVAIGATVAGVAAFKDQMVSIFSKG